MRPTKIYVDSRRVLGRRDARIYGQFLEHFHRQIYGGVYDPSSPFADASGLRKDVVTALRELSPAVLRWPGGCFASAYHWKDGIGRERNPSFDKAWRVEEPNLFGTDEFVALCRQIGAEPFLCCNAGTGSPEEMSDWVEYCNLRSGGRWARERCENGNTEPYGVRYWSIGNENYLLGEMGSKTIEEWGPFVLEAAKMMRRVDPRVEIVAPCVAVDKTYRAQASPFEWNVRLLQQAGDVIDWVSLHGYWDRLNRRLVTDQVSPYEACMLFSTRIEERIVFMKHLLGALGHLGRISIAFDEWNLRSWNHPNMTALAEADFLGPRDANDINSRYTMADAVFASCFLNVCLRHCDVVKMANFSPTVNARGAIFTHPEGLVLRPTYHVFRLYTRHVGDLVVDSWAEDPVLFEVDHEGERERIPMLDTLATVFSDSGAPAVVLTNRHPVERTEATLQFPGGPSPSGAVCHVLSGPEKDAYNDIDHPDTVNVTEEQSKVRRDGSLSVPLPPHSVVVVSPH
jgi:alpha-N-arabinofuranosidase